MGDNNAPTLSLSTKQLIWGSALDEEAFFNWLKDIDAVEDVHGKGQTLFVKLKTNRPDDQSLRELLALFTRYDVQVGLPQLAQFLTTENECWFKDPEKYWHSKVFP